MKKLLSYLTIFYYWSNRLLTRTNKLLLMFALLALIPLTASAVIVINGITYTVTYALGDSLTYGEYTFGQPHLGGYRGVVYEELTKFENPLFVGTSRENSLPVSTLPAAAYSYHDGHPGYRLDQLQFYLPLWSNALLTMNNIPIAPQNVDRILLMGGTNDIFQGAMAATAFGRFFSLVYGPGPKHEFPANPPGLLDIFPNAKIFVATIPPLFVLPGLVKIGEPEIALEYNAALRENIKQIKTQNPTLGRRLELVDQYTALLVTNAFNPIMYGVQVGDGIHPNSLLVDLGYATMGETWINAIVQAN